MNKLLKATGIFILGIGLLTGCSEKVAKKIDEPKQQVESVSTSQESKLDSNEQKQSDVKKVEGEKVTATQTSQVAPVKTQKVVERNNGYNHNFKEAGKVLDVLSYGILNFSGSTPANAIRYSVVHKAIDGQIIEVPATYVLDLVNTYNAETYTMNSFLNKLKAESGVTLIVLDKSRVDYSQAELEKMIVDQNTFVYFKKDNAFVFRGVTGVGGASYSMFLPSEQWQVEGERIVIPYVRITDHQPTGVITLRLNNKQYEHGNNKTMYYVEKFEIY